MLLESQPIVIVESDIPFVEDFVAALVGSGDPSSRHLAGPGPWVGTTSCAPST